MEWKGIKSNFKTSAKHKGVIFKISTIAAIQLLKSYKVPNTNNVCT